MKKFNKILFTSLFLILATCSFLPKAHSLEFKRRQGGELYLFGGDYLGDESENSWMAGAGYSFQFDETWGASFVYSYTPLRPNPGSPLAKDIKSKETHIFTPALIINNPIIMKTGKSHLSCDLFLTLGAGPMLVNSYWEPVGIVGGGIRVYLADWIAIRFDVNSYIHPIRREGSEKINADVGMMGGFGLLIPTLKSDEKKEEKTPKQYTE